MSRQQRKWNWGRILTMLAGNVFLAMGISIFKLSGLGNDPFNGMAMALADCTGITYANFVILVNVVLLVAEFLAGRNLIGAGTFVNAVLNGYIATFFYNMWLQVFESPETMVQRVIIVCIGVVVCSFGLSLYQTSDVGVAPYDSISLITAKRWPKITYFWHRIFYDALCALICFLAGGIVGLGTLISAFGLGPIIHFFNKYFTVPLLARIDESPIFSSGD